MRPAAATILFFAYNHEAFVEEALLSALGQDVGEFELVVVDDASTDGTRRIIEDVLLRATPAGVSVRRHYMDVNGGLLAAVNDAMALATGEVFMMMAGDDVSLPDRLSQSLDVFDADSQVQLVYGGCVKIDEAGHELAAYPSVERARTFDYGSGPWSRIYGGSSPHGATAAYRRTLYDFFGPMMAGSHGEDNCYWVRALLLGWVHKHAACLIRWRQHAGNLSHYALAKDDIADRARHLAWMDKHTAISSQWICDIAKALAAGKISSFRAWRLNLAARREDWLWALSLSSLRSDAWGAWLGHAGRLLATGRIATVFRMFKVRVSATVRERAWLFWAKMRSSTDS